jgi:hypothetical protein
MGKYMFSSRINFLTSNPTASVLAQVMQNAVAHPGFQAKRPLIG